MITTEEYLRFVAAENKCLKVGILVICNYKMSDDISVPFVKRILNPIFAKKFFSPAFFGCY
jgi:hypothetical protein